MENWRKRFRNQFVDTYGEKDVKEWRIAYQPIEELEGFISEELDKAREEGFNDGVEKTVGIIQKGLDELLLQKDGENYWVGDILRDCGYSVEKILPKNMKHYLSKLNK